MSKFQVPKSPQSACVTCLNLALSHSSKFVIGRRYIALKDRPDEGFKKGFAYTCISIRPYEIHLEFVEFTINRVNSVAYACSMLFETFNPNIYEGAEVTKEEKIQIAIESVRHYGVTNEAELKAFLEKP